MATIKDAIDKLPKQHATALRWFQQNAGNETSWPQPFEDGTRLVTSAKGIYKPKWSPYALSIRQTVDGPYADSEPIVRPDGSWSYRYYQEGQDPEERDLAFTNRGLMSCMQDGVPVGVMIQVSRKPNVRYQVLGPALVVDWRDGYFFFEGPSPSGQISNTSPAARVLFELGDIERAFDENQQFNPASEKDSREKILASIVQRRGQAAFRKMLLAAYSGKCAITGCPVQETLEAAHIVPYRGSETNVLDNGILLRADIHTLWDLGLIAINEEEWTVIVAPELIEGEYGEYHGVRFTAPAKSDSTLKTTLSNHRDFCGL